MKSVQVILGNQLFQRKYYTKASTVFMCEDVGLCTRFKYHKHKIVFFLSSMRHYAEELSKHAFNVHYHKISEAGSFSEKLKKFLKKNKVDKVSVYEIEDLFFEKEIEYLCNDLGVKLEIKKSPMFLSSRSDFKSYLANGKKPFMKTFYENWRQQTGILMEGGKPTGGKFSFDAENRKKVPKKFEFKKAAVEINQDDTTREVCETVNKLFPKHPGSCDDFWLACTRKDAISMMKGFFKNRFEHFGVYEDAIDDRCPFLFHSVLSPYINIGFITPAELVDACLKTDAPINSKEGFIRQVAGWREFIRGIYQNFGKKELSSNFFKHKRKMKSSWYSGKTGILPLDDAIIKTNKYAYSHHIERLMILSNLMLLSEIHPKEVYKWFMEMYADSSDWVMVPNVFGMGQFSDGGIFATKPYICGSNYILKMSHYKKADWCETMDGLYWRFIERHKKFFASNYRMAMMVKMLDKIEPARKKRIFKLAEEFIEKNTSAGR